jgi:hypothetical protein
LLDAAVPFVAMVAVVLLLPPLLAGIGWYTHITSHNISRQHMHSSRTASSSPCAGPSLLDTVVPMVAVVLLLLPSLLAGLVQSKPYDAQYQ